MNQLKIIDTKEAKEVHQYKNIKKKLHKINVTIFFNKASKTCNELCINW